MTGRAAATVGGYVTVPASLNAMGATTAVTIAIVGEHHEPTANWARVWDFNNSSTTGYMFLTTCAGQTHAELAVRFAITTTSNADEQMIMRRRRGCRPARGTTSPSCSARAPTYTGTLYIDGAVGRDQHRDDVAARPNLGNTANNWIGRSAFTADPYFNGLVDDFRVYNRALTAAEITALYAVR